MLNTQCVFCKRNIEIGDDDYRFCDDCVDKLEKIGADLDKAEKILMRIN